MMTWQNTCTHTVASVLIAQSVSLTKNDLPNRHVGHFIHQSRRTITQEKANRQLTQGIHFRSENIRYALSVRIGISVKYPSNLFCILYIYLYLLITIL